MHAVKSSMEMPDRGPGVSLGRVMAALCNAGTYLDGLGFYQYGGMTGMS